MNFAFSEEQEELRRSVRRFLEDKSPESEVRRLMETEDGYDPAVWSQMAQQLGLQGLAIPEEYGGSGYTYVELTVVLEEMGRALLCAPYFSTVALATNALLASGDDAAKKDLLPGIASGETIATVALTEDAGRWDEALEAAAEAAGLAEANQMELVAAAADLIAASLAANGVLQVFGTGHSEAAAMELSGRAGGLIPTNKLALRDIILLGGEDPKVLADPKAERDADLARRVWDLAPIGAGDVVVIASQSGGNGSTVEMAAIAKETGHPLIALTSLAHSTAITSRHPSGKRLFELADVVIDNGAPYGDTVLPLPGGGAVNALSSIGNALIAQLLVTEVTARMLAAGVEPPVYLSANIAKGDAHNDAWEARYAGRIRRSAY